MADNKLNHQKSSFSEKLLKATIRVKKSGKLEQKAEEEMTSQDQPLAGTSQDQNLQLTISQLKVKLSVAHSQIMINSEELAKTLNEEQKAKDSIAVTEKELMKAGKQSVEELRKSYEAMKEQLQQTTDEYISIFQQMKAYKRQLDDSNERLSNLKERNQTLQDQLDVAQRSALKDQEKFQDLKRANVVLQKKLQESKLKIQELEVAEREYIVNQKQVETQQKDIKALQEALESTGRQSWLVSNEEVQFSDEIIGEGSYGNVCVAMFRGTRVAAKSIHSIIISDYNKDIFIREMSLSAAVRHPNIVQFIGAADLVNPILLYELMATSLHSHLQKGQPLTHPQIIDAGCDIAAALSYLHQHKPHPIIHRDISSPNVLMDPLPRGKWKHKLSDLGAANLQCYVKTKYPGNPCYAAPEASDWNCQSPAMDVYSFGVLLMEITLNRAPETECGLRTLQAKRIQWNPVGAIVEQCIVEDRFQRQMINYVLQHLRSL